ncbi:hypothetical protein U3516DRAFT_817266 [Neocallimastix sp. 'constans']
MIYFKTYYLVDLQSVGIRGLNGAMNLSKNDYIHLFSTIKTPGIPTAVLSTLNTANVIGHDNKESVRSVDDQIISFLGFLIGQNELNCKYVIISLSKCYNKIIKFWKKERNISIQRQTSFFSDTIQDENEDYEKLSKDDEIIVSIVNALKNYGVVGIDKKFFTKAKVAIRFFVKESLKRKGYDSYLNHFLKQTTTYQNRFNYPNGFLNNYPNDLLNSSFLMSNSLSNFSNSLDLMSYSPNDLVGTDISPSSPPLPSMSELNIPPSPTSPLPMSGSSILPTPPFSPPPISESTDLMSNSLNKFSGSPDFISNLLINSSSSNNSYLLCNSSDDLISSNNSSNGFMSSSNLKMTNSLSMYSSSTNLTTHPLNNSSSSIDLMSSSLNGYSSFTDLMPSSIKELPTTQNNRYYSNFLFNYSEKNFILNCLCEDDNNTNNSHQRRRRPYKRIALYRKKGFKPISMKLKRLNINKNMKQFIDFYYLNNYYSKHRKHIIYDLMVKEFGRRKILIIVIVIVIIDNFIKPTIYIGY